MATDTDERFEAVDWDAEATGRRPSTQATANVAVVVLSVLGYVYETHLTATDLVPPRGDGIDLAWPVSNVDWLFVVSLALIAVNVGFPLARNPDRTRQYWRRLRADRLGSAAAVYLAVFFVLGLFGPVVLGSPTIQKGIAFQPPVLFSISSTIPTTCLGERVLSRCTGTMAHPLGTTFEGKDVLLMVIMAMRITLQVAVIAAAIIVPVATVVGTTAGYLGGWVDDVLMRYVDLQQAIPAFLVYIIGIFLYGRSLFLIVVVFGLFSWGGVARMIRSEVLSRREEMYTMAARSAGASHLQVVRRHLLPNVSGTVVTATTLQVPAIVLAEAALAFLRLNETTLPSFGDLIAGGTIGRVLGWTNFTEAWWIATIPALFLAVTVLSFGLLGDALRDVLDPRGASERRE
ncbi:ABC transporter permease [Halomarina oriensis]|uniref:ABC transporter permease subunit n=1 Tax=Halomarina oriensis TaxID=671145 RepID=A0A6B0GED7_9EURY|nr:ABC transporter permease [Halomarina oriensis]MWG32890.1 ABC transporter permease subunit [Halomarina oriensis]